MKPINSMRYLFNRPFGPCQKLRQEFKSFCQKVLLSLGALTFLSPLVCALETLSPNMAVPSPTVEEKTLEQQLDHGNQGVPPKSHWMENLFAEEETEGQLENMKNQVQAWEETEEYNKNWNLESTGLYPELEKNQKMAYLRKNALKYLDKRITKEADKAEPQSGLKKVGNLQKALKPSTQMQISQGVNLKFKAQVLQGKATVFLNNPLFHWTAELNAQGRVQVSLIKDLEDFGIKTQLNYNSKQKVWEAAINKKLSRSISSTVSSSQNPRNMAFTDESDRKVEVNFVQPF